MKLLFCTTLLVTIAYVSGGKTARLLAAMNAMNAMGMGVNPAAAGLLGGGLVPPPLVRPIVFPGGAGFIGQPQFPQFVPAGPAYGVPAYGVPAYGVPASGVPRAPIPNMFPAQAVNQFPYMGVAQMGPINPAQPLPQQQVMGGFPMANIQQQQPQPIPVQPDILQRFRRQVMVPDNTATTVDTQIPPPTEESRPCKNNVGQNN